MLSSPRRLINKRIVFLGLVVVVLAVSFWSGSRYPQLDEMTAGLQRGDLIIIAARPSMGKTSLAMNVCAHAALNHGCTAGVFSLEMSHQQLFLRLLCSEGHVDAHKLRTGRVDREEWQGIIEVFGRR